MQVPIVTSVDSLIREIRFATGTNRWLSGDCFKLYRILKAAYSQAKCYYDIEMGHVYTEIDGMFYDINGACFGRDLKLIEYSELEPRLQRELWEFCYDGD